MRFWDSSALVPLLCPQAAAEQARAYLLADPTIATWAWSAVECVSAVERQRRARELAQPGVITAFRRLDDLRRAWHEVNDLRAVRARAEQCLRLYPLRAADAGQLGAALWLAERVGQRLTFVTFDDRLADAARREGFDVLPSPVLSP